MFEVSELKYIEYGESAHPKLSITIERSDHRDVTYVVNFNIVDSEIIFQNINFKGSNAILGEVTKYELGAAREAVEYIQWHDQYRSYDIVTPFDFEVVQRYLEDE